MSFQKVRKGLLCCLLLFFGLAGTAQEVGVLFSEDKITATNGEVLSFSLKLHNSGPRELPVRLRFFHNEKDLKVLSPEKEYNLKPNDSSFTALRVMLAGKSPAGKAIPLRVALVDQENTILASDQVEILIPKRKLLKLQVLERNLMFEDEQDSLEIPVRIFNEGNSSQQMRLISRFPKDRSHDQLENISLVLEPFTDTIITLKRKVEDQFLDRDNFEVRIRGVYENGDIFGSGRVMASAVKERRRFSPSLGVFDPNNFRQSNVVSLSLQKNRDHLQYFGYANTVVETGRGTLESNVDVNWWENSDQLLIRNTWLGYEEEGFGARIGNIFRSDVVNLIGRGAEAYVEDAWENRFEAGLLNKSYNLVNNSGMEFGNAAWFRFSSLDGWKNDGNEVSLIYDDDPNIGFRNVIGTARMSLIEQEETRLKIGGSLSNAALYEDPNIDQYGASGELIYFKRSGNLSISSNNFWSSGYFAGLRRGSLNLMERINYRAGNYNLWASFNRLSFQPDQLPGQRYLPVHFANSRYNVGVSRQISTFSVSLSPNYYTEERSGRLLGREGESFWMKAKRFSLGMNFAPGNSRQYLSLNFDGGWYTTNAHEGEQPHFKTNLNYHWGPFNLNAFYQYNSFFLGETLTALRFASEDPYSLATVMPSLQHGFFDQKLKLRAGLSYSRNSLTMDFMQLNGRADYELPGNFNVFFNTFYSNFSNSFYAGSTMQFGIIKRFAPIRLDEQNHNLEVYVYHNLGNQEQEPASGELVIINDRVFRTNARGVVRYRNLPADTYSISFFNSREWYAPKQDVVLEGNTRLEIPMNRTISIKGHLEYQFEEYSYNIAEELSGIRVILKGDQGQEFTARTDNNGNFRAYVEEGTYTISLDRSYLPELVDIEENSKYVKAEQDTQVPPVKFILKVREREVKRTRFPSGGF